MRNQGIGSWPRRRARMTPKKVALTCDGRDLTYAELAERVDRLANALRGLGIRRGDRVAYLGVNHTSYAETLFALGLLGAVFVPLNHRLTAPELQYILDDSGAELLICGRSHRHMAEQLRVKRTIVDDESGEYEKLVASGAPEPIDEEVSLGDLCLIMYTSGTTGKPKGAMLSHGNLTWNTYNLLVDVDLTSSEVTLISAPLFHIAALAQTLLPTLIKGGRSILEASFDVDRTYDLIESERVTIMFGVPAMFNFIAQSPRWDTADLSSLRNLLCGGTPVPEPLIRRYQERGLTFLQGYGMTETSPGALFLSAEDSVRKAGTAGVPSFFTDVRVVTADGRDAAPGEPGEVIVQGPNVMLGYWNKPEATAEALRDGWFHSGDIAVKDEEGYARIADRLKDMIISGGENIYPAEVEEVLYGHPAVAECAVIGVPDERWGEVGKAIVVLRPGMTATAEEIIKFFDGRLARYKIPKHVEFVDALPRNGSGKILKHVLRERHG